MHAQLPGLCNSLVHWGRDWAMMRVWPYTFNLPMHTGPRPHLEGTRPVKCPPALRPPGASCRPTHCGRGAHGDARGTAMDWKLTSACGLGPARCRCCGALALHLWYPFAIFEHSGTSHGCRRWYAFAGFCWLVVVATGPWPPFNEATDHQEADAPLVGFLQVPDSTALPGACGGGLTLLLATRGAHPWPLKT